MSESFSDGVSSLEKEKKFRGIPQAFFFFWWIVSGNDFLLSSLLLFALCYFVSLFCVSLSVSLFGFLSGFLYSVNGVFLEDWILHSMAQKQGLGCSI